MNLKSDDFFSELDIVVIQFSIQDSILDHKKNMLHNIKSLFGQLSIFPAAIY